MDPEFLRALELVAEYDRQRPKMITEYRLYYNDLGEITGYCETNHPPDSQYIVLASPDQYFKQNTHQLRVIDGALVTIEKKHKTTGLLTKSTTGQPVVAGMATIAIMPNETYDKIEYYDRPTNN